MAVIRWNPWSLSNFLEDDWDLPTIPGLSRLGQGLNIYETDDAIVAEVALPGVSEDKIDVTVENNVVRVSATTKEIEQEKEKRRYYINSISSSYNYSFKLPTGVVKDEEPQGELNNGILTLVFPKIEKAPPKKIKVGKTGK